MNKTYLRTLGILSLGMSAFLCSPTHGAPIEFASFNLSNADQPFSWTNNTTSGSMLVNQANVQFSFTMQSGFPSTYDATLSLFSGASLSNQGPSTNTPATGGFFDEQPLNQTITLAIANNSIPANQSGHNLLTAVFTNANLFGIDGSSSATTTGQDTVAGQTVTFTSDYGTFTSPGNSFNLGLTTLTSPVSIGAGGFLSSFVSNLDGQFTANAADQIHNVNTPEPASAALLGIGVLGLLVRRRNAV